MNAQERQGKAPEPEFLTRGQVATRLGVSPERVRQLAQSGRLRWVETPLGRLYDPESVAAVIRARDAIPTPSQSRHDRKGKQQ